MTESDYPALWKASDAAALRTQRFFLFLVRLHLGLLALAGLVAAWSPSSRILDQSAAGLIAVLMFAALVTGLVLRLLKADDIWFRNRAFAENAKGAAWRLMMAPSADAPGDDETREREFLEELKQIRARYPETARDLSTTLTIGPEISLQMRALRKQSTMDRLSFYTRHRLEDQIHWYSSKAKCNRRSELKWFTVILLAEGLAVLFAFGRILYSAEYDPTGAVAALAACFVAWVQTKRFSDLANTYAVACVDLKGLLARADHVHTEVQLQDLVQEAENAISREHRLWVERRSALA